MSFAQLFAEAEPFVREHGPVVVGLVLFFESFGVPLPGESLLVVSGTMAGRGEISLVGLLLCAWAGAVAGDSVGYAVGRFFGRGLIVHHGARVGLTHERFGRVENVFCRYGPVAVVFARYFDVLRQFNGIVAGTAGMPWPRFLAFNALGGALWVATWGLGAYWIGHHAGSFTAFARHVGPWGMAGLALAAAAIAALVVVIGRRTWPKRQAAGA